MCSDVVRDMARFAVECVVDSMVSALLHVSDALTAASLDPLEAVGAQLLDEVLHPLVQDAVREAVVDMASKAVEDRRATGSRLLSLFGARSRCGGVA
jgi:hypothetical protein